MNTVQTFGTKLTKVTNRNRLILTIFTSNTQNSSKYTLFIKSYV